MVFDVSRNAVVLFVLAQQNVLVNNLFQRFVTEGVAIVVVECVEERTLQTLQFAVGVPIEVILWGE